MKFHLAVFLGFLTSSQINAFTYLCTSRSPAMRLRATSEGTEAQTVTKEDLLAARDEIDKILREKACGT